MAVGSQPEYLRPQVVFILVGLPGSGKSYFARKMSEPFEDGLTPNIVTLCQGTMTRDVFDPFVAQTIHQKTILDDDNNRVVAIETDPLKLPHVIIDRCNSKPNDRKAFISMVRHLHVEFKGKMVPRRIVCLVHFDFSEYYCVQLLDRRLKMKEDHPTVHDKETADKAMFLHKKMFQKPNALEINETDGDRFVRISTPEQMANFIKKARRWL